MADSLTTFEKYPDSWRLDHPDFQDVKKTGFAKGVITEIKMDWSNHGFVNVTSLAKVKVDGVESDFIPLCFCPKKDYWDTDEAGSEAHPSQQFNEEGKYYENAWMSFRAGDEVVVMLQAPTPDAALKPVAVLAFADNIPREGESILKIVGPQETNYIQCTNRDPKDYTKMFYSGKEVGPDGKSLKLVKQAECILDKSYENVGKDGDWTWPFNKPSGNSEFDPLGEGKFYIVYDWMNTLVSVEPGVLATMTYNFTRTGLFKNQKSINNKERITVRHYLLSVGPMLYFFQFVWKSNYADISHHNNKIQIDKTQTLPLWNDPRLHLSGDNAQEVADLVWAALVYYTNVLNYPEDIIEGFRDGDWVEVGAWGDMSLQCINVMAAPYSDALYQQAKGASVSKPPYGAACVDFEQDYPQFTFYAPLNSALNQIAASLVAADFPFPPADINFYTRPHTKEELQDAGLLPKQ